MTNGKNDTVDELITKHLAGETTHDEEKELLSWINANEENKRRYADLKKAFGLAAQYLAFPPAPDIDVDVDREWDKFRESVGEHAGVRQLTPARFWARIAATILVLLATGAILYYFGTPAVTRYETASAAEEVTLPDGSTVALNRNTLLSFEKDFGEKNRTITLKGEAFFRVQPDASRPFIILTGTARIQVVGTSFTVSSFDSLDNIEVVVQTGIVSLASKTGDRNVKLIAGQKGVYSKTARQIETSANNDVNFMAWKTHHIVFEDQDLRSVVATLEKVYNADITVAADLPASCMVTVTFDHQSLESVLKVLQRTLNLKYTLKGNKVKITDAGC